MPNLISVANQSTGQFKDTPNNILNTTSNITNKNNTTIIRKFVLDNERLPVVHLVKK